MKAKINEIFNSIQGEGPYTGTRQVFVRFSDCNMNCVWCDTLSSKEEGESFHKQYSVSELLSEVNEISSGCHSVSLTGGEPLLQYDFIKQFAKVLKQEGKRIYLETNGICCDALKEVIDQVDIIAMDIKLPSSTKERPFWEEHGKFLGIALQKEVFIKVVVSGSTTNEDVKRAVALVYSANPSIPFVLQPSDYDLNSDAMKRCVEVRQFCEEYLLNVHIMLQMHKMVGMR